MNRARFIIMVACLPFIGGCVTPGSTGQEVDVKKMASTAKSAAYFGAALYLDDNPQDVQRFREVINALEVLVQTENYDPISLHAALSKLPIKELKSPKAVIIVTAAQVLWDGYVGEIVDLDRATYVAPVLSAIKEGLELAVSAQPEG